MAKLLITESKLKEIIAEELKKSDIVDIVKKDKDIEKHIKEFGEDYRFEEREHPVVALRKRDEDNYVLGRVKGKIGI